MRLRLAFLILLSAACTEEASSPLADAGGGGDGADGAPGSQADAAPPATGVRALGTVEDVSDLDACPAGAPRGATCKRLTVTGCADIEDEPLAAIIAVLEPTVADRTGTIVRFSGGGGESFKTTGAEEYAAAGFRQVMVAWMDDWEQTADAGIKVAACRPATVVRWVFDEPTLHGASRAVGFCAEGSSGGAGQLSYALAHYGLGDVLDHVNLVSGPPFARIDLGCDGSEPATATVCGAEVTTRLPAERLDVWTNVAPPDTCGGSPISAEQVARWQEDSVAVGGVYAYPTTRVESFVCTNQATAVTYMGQLLQDLISSDKAFHCYSAEDGCKGEGLGAGSEDVIAAMIAGCVPRH